MSVIPLPANQCEHFTWYFFSIKNCQIDGVSCYWYTLDPKMCCGCRYGLGCLGNMVPLYSEWYLNCSDIFQSGLLCQFISAKVLPNILLQTGFNCNLSTIAPVAMTNSFGLVNLLNIIALCYFDKSIMLWFTYALEKTFIGTFYTKFSLVYTNKASAGLMLRVAFQYLNHAKFSWFSKLTRCGEERGLWS